MKGYLIGIIFIVGLALGVVGMIYGPDYLEPYMPGVKSLGGGKGQPVEGRVVAKLPRADKLLITVSTPEGASLVTFNQKVDEISLLVEEGDYITLKLHRYEPFVMNPSIIRVRKESPAFSGKVPSKPEGVELSPGEAQEAPSVQEQEMSKPEKAEPESKEEPSKPEPEEAPQQETPKAGEKI